MSFLTFVPADTNTRLEAARTATRSIISVLLEVHAPWNKTEYYWAAVGGLLKGGFGSSEVGLAKVRSSKSREGTT